VGEKCSDKFRLEFDFHSEGRRAENFFALKNPTASAGFEPANLGTKGQRATSRPPKPIYIYMNFSPYIKRLLNQTFTGKVEKV